ncbi:MAG TPA: hypothetical protein VK961_18090 [Chthoniobacter sp.]|nr:hypothetical protein [Chthoniobacter sp.]
MRIPGAHVFSYYLRRARYRYRQRFTEKGLVGQWHLLCAKTGAASLADPQPQTMKKIIAPPDRYWADPFVWQRDGAFFIFCEEMQFGARHGHISAVPIDGEGNVSGPAIRILDQPYHLSYPFLFEHEGELYMLPESGFANVLNLYRCVEFPARWERARTIFEGVQYCDSTLLEHDGRWWLFATVRNPRRLQLPEHDLLLFSAESPLAEHWTPHPRNAIVQDFRRARPAGRIFRHDGRLIRPSQNCGDRYGGSLNLNEIVRLNADEYDERLVREVKPDGNSRQIGLHHIDWHQGVLVMDMQRLVPASEVTYSAITVDTPPA